MSFWGVEGQGVLITGGSVSYPGWLLFFFEEKLSNGKVPWWYPSLHEKSWLLTRCNTSWNVFTSSNIENVEFYSTFTHRPVVIIRKLIHFDRLCREEEDKHKKGRLSKSSPLWILYSLYQSGRGRPGGTWTCDCLHPSYFPRNLFYIKFLLPSANFFSWKCISLLKCLKDDI